MCMKQWNRYIILVYCTVHIYLEHGRWYSAGFVDILVCVGDAVILDTTEWVSSGGVDTAPTARLNAAIAEIRAQCEGLLPNNHWKTEAQFKYGVNYFRSKHKYTHTLTRFCIFLFYSSLFSASDSWMLNWKLFFPFYLYDVYMLPVLYYTSLVTAHQYSIVCILHESLYLIPPHSGTLTQQIAAVNPIELWFTKMILFSDSKWNICFLCNWPCGSLW